jgi:hypothetical protein
MSATKASVKYKELCHDRGGKKYRYHTVVVLLSFKKIIPKELHRSMENLDVSKKYFKLT